MKNKLGSHNFLIVYKFIRFIRLENLVCQNNPFKIIYSIIPKDNHQYPQSTEDVTIFYYKGDISKYISVSGNWMLPPSLKIMQNFILMQNT